jgi:hypothetical protein
MALSQVETALAERPTLCRCMDDPDETTSSEETFNPWSIVNLVFHHLASQGLHPVLGEAGDPGAPAADLLRALGIKPAAEGNRMESEQRKQRLAEIRAAFEMSHVESP